jgi:hypothetical protein
MHKFLIILNIYFSGLPGFVPGYVPDGDYKKQQIDLFSKIARSFLFAKERSFQEKATREDVEEVLKFCSDTIRYDHILSPNKKFSFNGKSQW